MKAYADIEFYMTEYLCGKEPVIGEDPFDFYARSATAEIRTFTGSNINENSHIPECVKMCCCELAELIFKDEKTAVQTEGVSSESVGGWSKSYESGQSREESRSCKIRQTVYKWLGGTGLLFRGVR